MPIATLRYGMQAQKVVRLQRQLKKLGYFSGNATGFYGPVTRSAVSSFEKANGLARDGVADPQMRGLLATEAKAGGPAAPTSEVKRTARAVPSNGRVVVIGDSHTAGAFGQALKKRLSAYLKEGGGTLASFTGVSSSSVSNFLHGTSTNVGGKTLQTPRLDSLLSVKPRPTHLVVALGTNMLFGSKAANAEQIRALLAKADAAGVRVTWVGPPNVHGYGGNLAGDRPEARFYAALHQVNDERRDDGKPRMRIVDSRRSTSESQTADGLHFTGERATAWARDVYKEAVR